MFSLGFSCKLVVVFFALLLLPATSSASSDWWDWGWHYRALITANASSADREDKIAELEINFSELLGPSAASEALDPKSIRVVEQGDGVYLEAVSQFDQSTEDPWSGELLWLIEGKMGAGSEREYYVYFDVVENGEKQAPEYSEGVIVQSKESDLRIDTAKLMIFMDREKYGFSHLVFKRVDWENVATPSSYDPLEQSRSNVSEYRGFFSTSGEHYCDPGCAWERANSSAEIIYQGPLRAVIRSTSTGIRKGGESQPFLSETYTYVYSGEPYYITRKAYHFEKSPRYVTGLNRWMWIFGGTNKRYKYPVEGGGYASSVFPPQALEAGDWKKTWSDSYDEYDGIATMELGPEDTISSLWLEKDEAKPGCYSASMWRPYDEVDYLVDTRFAHYFHLGQPTGAQLDSVYEELSTPLGLEVDSATSFVLSISAPENILNWDPTLPLKAEVEDGGANITIISTNCSVYNEDAELFRGELSDEGIRIFEVPEGRWTVKCVAESESGHLAWDETEVMVYDVMSVVKLCLGSMAVLLALIIFMVLRMRQIDAESKARKIECPRCGMMVAESKPACPVCGKKLVKKPAKPKRRSRRKTN